MSVNCVKQLPKRQTQNGPRSFWTNCLSCLTSVNSWPRCSRNGSHPAHDAHERRNSCANPAVRWTHRGNRLATTILDELITNSRLRIYKFLISSRHLSARLPLTSDQHEIFHSILNS